jgi:secernin
VCDTLVTLSDGGVLFAKNSDREPNEAQVVEWHAGARHPTGASLRCTYIEIPQVERTNGVLVCRPWWMWGAEMGANEHGVVIGNEAVWTREPDGEPALLGMDLLRLALERASTAHEAVSVIVDLLERHGQGGACSHDRPGFRYHNSFLVADPDGAVVLETAGRRHATEQVRGRGRSISNELTIPELAAACSDRFHGRLVAARRRRAATERAACAAGSPADLMAVLRQHAKPGPPVWSWFNGTLQAPCVHAGGLVASSQTTGSLVVDLRDRPLCFVTGTSAPCTSVFKPVRPGEPLPPDASPRDRFSPASRWWRHELLHRATLRDHAALLARYRPERDRIEQSFLADPPPAVDAFAVADALERRWLVDVSASGLPDVRPAWLRRWWERVDRAAGLGEEGVAA